MSKRAEDRRASRLKENKMRVPKDDMGAELKLMRRQLNAALTEIQRLTKENRGLGDKLHRLEGNVGLLDRTLRQIQPVVDRISRVIR